MQQQPSVIATGDFLYFAPAGQAFTIPGAGTVGVAAKPGAADAIWTTFALGSVKKPIMPKLASKEAVIMAPLPGTGIIAPKQVLRTEHNLTLEVEINEISRLSMAGFYQSPLIQLTDTGFFPLSGNGSFNGWLKVQRYDASNPGTPWQTQDWWVDLNVTDLATGENNIINPKFKFTWLYSALAGGAI